MTVPLGRLFWKFFLAFWLAQVLTSTIVGLGFWLSHRDRPPHERPGPPPACCPPPGAERGPPPGPPGAGDPTQAYGRPPPGPPGPPGGSRLMRPPVPQILAGSVVSLLFAGLMAWYFSRPIRTLRSAFEAVAGGRLETRIGAGMGARRDELADLGSEFDRMADRLQVLLDSQRRLLHDVSHELRSPLARVQAAIDLMRQQPERAVEFVGRIERDAGRMDRLVGELLTLARLEAGTATGLDGEVDLGEVLAEVVADARFEASAKECVVTEAAPADLRVTGSADLLHRAVENIVRNAVRHAPAGSEIEVKARGDASAIEVTVADRGVGVPAEHLEDIFAPFFRLSSSATAPGYGLGLAIARHVVQAHGGTITARNREAGGLLVTITLPARRA